MFRQADLDPADVPVGFEKMSTQRQTEFLRFRAEFLFRQNVDRVLHRVRRHDEPVVGFGEGRIEIALQHDLHFDFLDGMPRAVAENFQHAHPRLAVVVLDQFHGPKLRARRTIRPRLSTENPHPPGRGAGRVRRPDRWSWRAVDLFYFGPQPDRLGCRRKENDAQPPAKNPPSRAANQKTNLFA